MPALKEKEMADWLNQITTILGEISKCEPLRLWSDRSCDTPPIGSPIKRKPGLILLDKKYYNELQDPNKQTDWAFIRSFAEVTRSPEASKQMTDTINAKSYLLFLCQHDRRFTLALSFTGDRSVRLTVADREGIIRWNKSLVVGQSRQHAQLFLRILSFLSFGSPVDIGLDPNVEIDHTGKCVAITVEGKRFVVVEIIYSLDSIVGRGTRVWVVTHGTMCYTLKDSWTQHKCVDSELLMLEKMLLDDKLTGRVPTLFCGGEVKINGVVDCTGRYREDLPGWSSMSQCIHCQLVCTPIGEALTEYRSKKEFINAIKSIISSALPVRGRSASSDVSSDISPSPLYIPPHRR